MTIRGSPSRKNHELIVNAALLDRINVFLLEKTDADRADQLRAWLKSELLSPAYGEAVQIVERYQTYMKVHDELLSVQHLAGATDASAVDIERVAVWWSAARTLAAKHTGRCRRAGVVPERWRATRSGSSRVAAARRG
ncbi:hypothetical protein [Paraburkholderia sp. BR10882]|uniref:hypothetical protein n=1 Tax=unclassified Paraburkholderia TaxID=2615204 RepID=UPI0034CF3DAD